MQAAVTVGESALVTAVRARFINAPTEHIRAKLRGVTNLIEDLKYMVQQADTDAHKPDLILAMKEIQSEYRAALAIVLEEHDQEDQVIRGLVL